MTSGTELADLTDLTSGTDGTDVTSDIIGTDDTDVTIDTDGIESAEETSGTDWTKWTDDTDEITLWLAPCKIESSFIFCSKGGLNWGTLLSPLIGDDVLTWS